jgi:hypothetical protein
MVGRGSTGRRRPRDRDRHGVGWVPNTGQDAPQVSIATGFPCRERRRSTAEEDRRDLCPVQKPVLNVERTIIGLLLVWPPCGNS